MSAHDYTADVRDRAEAAIAAVAELVEAVRDVYGDDCEQVCETSCPTCRIRRALAKFGGAACTLRDARPAPQQPAPVEPVGVDDGINVPAAKALIKIVGPGFKVIYRDAFRWKDASGDVLPNHYEMFSAETLARDFGYDLVLDLGYAAILRDPSALSQRPTPKPDAVDDETGVEFFAVPEGLHPNTTNLVARFATALAEKLAAAERKYGYSDGWADAGWMDECRQKLVEHIAKGDPRDVAAYCAFLWHHGESTAGAKQPAAADEESSKGADVARPKRRRYDPNGSLSEYGIFPECDAQPLAEEVEAQGAVDEAVKCPECGREWPWESEQAVAVGLQGACIACTMKYPDGTHEESQRRYSFIAALGQRGEGE